MTIFSKKEFHKIQLAGVLIIVILFSVFAYFLGKTNPPLQIEDTFRNRISPSNIKPKEVTPVRESAPQATTLPTKPPKPVFEVKGTTYINNQKGFSFQFSKTLTLNSSVSDPAFGQFLEHQEGTGNVARLTLQVYENPKNLTLEQIVAEKGILQNDPYGLIHEQINVDGHEALRLAKVLSQKELCNFDDDTIKHRVFHLLIKADGYVAHLTPNNSCESFQRDWFDITPSTFKFLNKG